MCRINVIHILVHALLASLLSVTLASALIASEDECERTSQMRVYSDASYIKEAGDVVGHELAVLQREGSSINALLYFYEGVPNKDGVSVSGHFAGGKLALEGDWVEHLIEHPSNKEIVETHHVTVNGTLDSIWFRGAIKVVGLVTPIKVRLKRVSHIWLCGGYSEPLRDGPLILYPAKAVAQSARQQFLVGNFKIIENVEELPQPVLRAFTEEGGKRMLLANPGKEFIAGDDIYDPSLPRKRLIFAGVLDNKCFVYYEQGGWGLADILAFFGLTSEESMEPVWRGYCGPAADIQDLRLLVSKGRCSDPVPPNMK